MAIVNKDISTLSQKASVAGNEKLPVSPTEYITPDQITSGKSDKDSDAVEGNIAVFDSSGNPVDGGIAANDVAEKDGNYPDMTVGNLTAPVTQNNQEIVFRKAGGSLSIASQQEGGAVIQRIKGRSIVWNFPLRNANFASTADWVVQSAGFAVSNNVATITYNTGGDSGIAQDVGAGLYGHKILMKFEVTAITGTWSCGLFRGVSNNLLWSAVTSYSINAVGKYQYIFTPNNALASPAITYAFGFGRADTIGRTISVRDCVFIDLTLMFGSGNEPSTVEEFEAMFPLPYYDYNAGEIINNAATGIETVGFNLYDHSTGTANVFAGKEYYVGGTYTSLSLNGTAVTLSSNKFTAIESGVLTVVGGNGTNTIVNLSDPNRNGQYEPYWKQTLPIPITTMRGKKDGVGASVVVFPDGLRSAGNVKDEIVGNEAIKRVGVVDLGSLDWEPMTSLNEFYSSLPTQKYSVSDSNCVCSIYATSKFLFSYMPDKEVTTNMAGFSANPYIIIKDTSFSGDYLAFKAAMSGVMFYYELATHEEYILDTPPSLSYRVDEGGTERRLPEDTAASPLAPFVADIRYALNGAGTLQRLDDNYVSRRSVAQGLGNDPNKVISQQALTRELGDIASRIILSGVPADLSYYDVSGAMLLKRETSNCYVVRGKGLYKIPLVYGNAIHHGKDNPAAYTRLGSTYTADFVNHLGNNITSPFIEKNAGCTAASAGLLWQTGQSIIDAVDLIDGNDCRYVRFNVANVPATNGLAVLYVKDASDNIMWSWTLWLTTDVITEQAFVNHTGVTYNLMPENLFAVWNAGRTSYASPTMQWGRKDVFVPNIPGENTQMTVYDINGDAITPGVALGSAIGIFGAGDDASAYKTVANAIRNPGMFFTRYDATNYNWNNLSWFNNFWNAAETSSDSLADNQDTAVKTVYDPCPYGWTLPAGRAFTGFTTTGENSSTSSQFNVIGSFSGGWTFKRSANDASGNKFLASGYRGHTSGAVSDVGSDGPYWTFAPSNQQYVRRLLFHSVGVCPLDYGHRTSGFPVRPCKEY